ncbi:flagellar protein FlgN [Aestuariibacter halophilus]|uniref:Flagellar protein FlgN n=1 Tax=Fluctibacter halophilus TaxID=226011 RepID=A0ABS8G3B8_9ALTE|nr:flagellar protein FlgN [Aestuariibacter halophilus]MCC2615077.1 flagellar protein FlgN [Aestuariibacter halophilus]
MSDIVDLLKQQLALLDSLKGQLENELHLISSRDAEALTQLLTEKSTTLDSIAACDKAIGQAYKAGVAPEQQDTIDNLKAQIVSELQECQYRTEINAKAVEQGQLRLEHLRNLLVEARAKESMTYDKSGKTRGGKSGPGVKA